VLEQIGFIEEYFNERRLALPRLLVANKADVEGAGENFAALEELYRGHYRCLMVSAATGQNLEGFARAVFDLLEIVRVYTTAPGKKADLTSPFILRRGGTVLEAARLVHKDFAENLKSARLYQPSGEHDGALVERARVVEDEDILEFHI
jgi:ribosome-interacting GTPase 1